MARVANAGGISQIASSAGPRSALPKNPESYQPDPQIVARLEKLSRGCGLLVIAIGSAVIVGYALGVPVLIRPLSSLGGMAPNTAAGLLLGGIALWLQRDWQGSAWLRALSHSCALGLLLLGALSLAEYLLGTNLDIDQLLFRDPQQLVVTLHPARMAPVTAICFCLLALALLLRARPLAAEGLAAAGLLLVLVAAYGLGLSAEALYKVMGYIGIAPLTVLALLLMAIGILLLHPGTGFMAVVTAPGIGGQMSRRLLPLVIALPLLVTWLHLLGDRASFFPMAVGITLIGFVITIIFGGLLWFTARSLERADRQRMSSEGKMRNSELRFRRLFEAAQDGILILDFESGAIVEVNPFVTSLLGYTKVELVGKHLWEVGALRDVVTSKKAFAELQNKGYIRYQNLSLQTKSGLPVEVEFVSNAYLVEETRVIQCNIRDITKQRKAEMRLKESEIRFQALIENVADVICLVDQAGYVLYVSPAIRMVGGYEPGELLGRRFLDFVHPDDQAEALGLLGEMVRHPGTPMRRELRCRYKNGAWLHIETTAINRLALPSVGGIVATLRDITERRLAESAKANLAAIVESSQDGIIGVSLNGIITQWNFGAEKIYGYGASEVLGKHVRMLAPPELSQQSVEIIGRIQRGEEGTQLETARVRKDGSRFDAGYTFSPILDDHANIVGVSSTVQDITKRKQAEQSLKLFRELINQSNDAIEVIDPETLRFLDVNDKSCKDLGYSREELLSKTVFDIDPIFDQAALRKVEEHFLKSDFLVLQTLHKRKNGSTFPVEVSIKRVKLDRSYNVTIVRDITERTNFEVERKKHADAINRSLEQTIHAVAMALEMRDMYTAGHMRRVADLSIAIAREMGLSEVRSYALGLAASIHDVGKINLPAEILSKPTRLTNIEYSLVKTHAQAGYEILKGVDFPWPIAEMVYQHHEQMDGSGYPRGLQGDQILVEARILAVADTVEAMASHRPYRASVGIEAALEEIVRKRGTSYDSNAVDACVRLFREKGYQLPSATLNAA